MNKFRVGDKVRVIGHDGGGHGFRIGDEVEVVIADTDDIPYKCKKLNGIDYWLKESELEPIKEDPTYELHLTVKGNETHAIMKKDGKQVKRAKAICHESDEFNFEEGVRIATARVFGKEPFENIKVEDETKLIGQWKEVKRRAKVDEWIEVKDAFKSKDCYKNGDRFKVKRLTRLGSAIVSTSKTHPYPACNQGESLIGDSEYVVLEGYDPSFEELLYSKKDIMHILEKAFV